MITDPWWTYFFMRGISVWESRFWASGSMRGTTTHFWEFRSSAPNNHVCLSTLPRSYFLFTIKVSSISTILSGPPIGCWFSNQNSVTSLQKLLQSTAVFLDISRLVVAWPWEKCFLTQRLIKHKICQGLSCVFSRNVPLLSLVQKLQKRLFFVLGWHMILCTATVFCPLDRCIHGHTLCTGHDEVKRRDL